MKLSEINVRIIELSKQGMIAKEIATELGLTKCAVDNRINIMKKKYGAKSLTHLTWLINHVAK